MKSKKWIIAIIVVVLLVGLGLSIFSSRIEVLGAKAGIVEGYRGEIPKIEETKIITLGEGVKFGWIIVTEEIDRDLRWREVLIFPEKPKNLAVTEETKISSDGRKAITKRSSNLKEGIIYNTWGLEKGDPLGRYKIKIYTQQGLIKEFSFKVK